MREILSRDDTTSFYDAKRRKYRRGYLSKEWIFFYEYFVFLFSFPIYIDTWNKKFGEWQDLRVIIRGKVNTEEIVFISHAIIAWIVQYATGKLVEREKMWGRYFKIEDGIFLVPVTTRRSLNPLNGILPRARRRE